MNCKELVYLLGEYLDGTMEEHLRNELDAHIVMCESCLHFLNTYDKTRILCRQVKLSEIPEEFRERLRSFVAQESMERHQAIEKYRKMAIEEQRRQVESLLRAVREGRLSPALAMIFEVHRDRCETCGTYLRTINGGEEPKPIPSEIEEHLAEFFDAIPPGEEPFRF